MQPDVEAGAPPNDVPSPTRKLSVERVTRAQFDQVRDLVAKSSNAGQTKAVRAGWVLDPRRVAWIAWWDIVATFALLFTAIMTPVEVAFIEPPPTLAERFFNALFLANRTVDLVFIIDIILQFRIAYKSENVHGTSWVVNPRQIAVHYVTSFWFPLDVFSTATSSFDFVTSSAASNLTVLRAVRTLRLLKLVKLARGSRVFRRWEMRLSINYDMLTLVGIVFIIILVCHWTACAWGLTGALYPLKSWMAVKGYCVPWGLDAAGALASNATCTEGWSCVQPTCTAVEGEVSCETGFACAGVADMYSYSLYFAIMTITSVGYGDIAASPFNIGEQVMCGIIMLGSGMLWGYLIGVFCALANVPPSVKAFRDELSQLNSFMAAYNLPSEVRFRLREFMHETIHLRDAKARTQLIAKLSPAMQGEVALLVNQEWIARVRPAPRS